jgi:mRNA interferase RelE/StbE
MIVNFDKSFLKSIKKLKNQSVKDKLILLIQDLENSNTISEIKNCKRLSGYKNYHRVRIGDYRLGLEENSSKKSP